MWYSMGSVAIRVEQLGKEYRLGSAEAYRTARESLMGAMRAPLRWLKGDQNASLKSSDFLWAVRDISFDVHQGDVVGVVGRNGAGKSTLLKLLSRVTEPTEGTVEFRGRIGSLLEVGTGFHPELTGRENIYLNGAILGMRRAEIRRKFDEMVAFADVERFLDTPVKRYSSGMYMRLAFAVAVHLEPEILVIDEVLAVGDAQFQKKCFSKMREVAKGGRTILFVSHNLAAVRQICTTGIILHRGALIDQGDVNPIIDKYLAKELSEESQIEIVETASFKVLSVEINGESGPVIKTFDRVKVMVSFIPKVDIGDPNMYVGFLTLDNQRLAGLDFKDFKTSGRLAAGKVAELGFCIDNFPLMPGTYQVEVHLKDMANGVIEILSRTTRFDVAETPVYGGRRLDSWFGMIGMRAHALLNQRS